MAKQTPQYIKISEFDLRRALRRINESRIEEMVETEVIQHEKYMDELLSDPNLIFEYEEYDDHCDTRMMQMYRKIKHRHPK